MNDVIVCMWLFLFGVLAIAGYLRLATRLGHWAEREERSHQRIGSLEESMDRRTVTILAQQKEIDALRAQLRIVAEGNSKMEGEIGACRKELEARKVMAPELTDDDQTQVYQARTTLVSVTAAQRDASNRPSPNGP